MGFFDGVEGDIVEDVVHLGLMVFLLEDGDGVEGRFVIGRIFSRGLLLHLPVFVGFFLAFLLEPEVDRVDQFFLVERLHG